VGSQIKLISDVLGTNEQFEGMGFTHDVENFNKCVACSSYKLLPSMEEKLLGQMEWLLRFAQLMKVMWQDW